MTPIPSSKCTSRPDCPCEFCVRRRSEPSKREVEERMAEDFIRAYQQKKP